MKSTENVISILNTINLSGYDVVKREAFSLYHTGILFINGKTNTITIRKDLLETLGNPPYLQFAIQPENCVLLINGATDDHVPDSVLLQYDEQGNGVIDDCRSFLSLLSEHLSWVTDCAYAVKGEQSDINGIPVFLFDLKQSLSFRRC